MDDDSEKKFVDNNPMFRGYTKTNCLLLQKQKILVSAFNCCMVYSNGLPGAPHCSPLEHVAIWNPNDTMKARHDLC